MKIHTFPTSSAAAFAAGGKLSEVLLSYQDVPVLLLVSGGSALALLEFVDMAAFTPRVTLGVLDERFAVSEPDTNFFKLSQLDFFRRARENHVYMLNSLPHDDDPLEKVASRYDASLKKWQENNPTGKIVTTQGIGPDGHTAGIMPMPQNPTLFRTLFDTQDVWVVGYDAAGTQSFPKRITVTFPFLRMANAAIVYACGGEKRSIVEKIHQKTGTPEELPALIVHEIATAAIYTDQVTMNASPSY